MKFDEIIESLNESHVRVLEIFHPLNRKETLRYYATDSFVPYSSTNDNHIVIGSDITSIIAENSLNLNVSNSVKRDDAIFTKITILPKLTKNFSKEYAYVWHLTLVR